MKKLLSDSWKSDFFSQMNVLIDAGLDMAGIFDVLMGECTEKDYDILDQIFDDVLSGLSLSESLKRTRKFSNMDIAVVGVGEITGELSQTMSFLSDYYSDRDRHIKMIRSSLSYPLTILSFAVLVLIFMLVVIVPVFSSIYLRMGSELPSITRYMMNLSAKVPAILVVSAVIVFLLLSVIAKFKDSKGYASVKSGFLMGMPFVRNLVKTDAQCTSCRLMSLLLSSGVSMMKSLELTAQSMSLIPFMTAFYKVKDDVRDGNSLSGSMNGFQDLFDKRILSIIRVGEESNRLPDMFDKASRMCASKLEKSFKSIQTWLEPIMIVFVGIIVGLVLVSMYLPMFKMGTTLLGN